jgi:hypothetical protein
MKTIQVAVPQLALDEAVNKYREDVVRATAEVGKLRSSLKRLGVEPDLSIPKIDELSGRYEDAIGKRLRKWGVATIAYPEVPHQQLARSAIAKRSPFDQQGRGYRDALIWYTVIGLAGDREVWLVTDDNDFRASGSDDLAADLVSDLESIERSAPDVRLFRTIKDCVAELGDVIEKPKQEINKRLKDDAGYLRTLTKGIEQGLDWKGINRYEVKPPASLADEITIEAVDDIRDVYVQDARLVTTGELLVRLDSIVDVTVGMFIEKSDIGDIEDYLANAEDESYDNSFEIDDWNWSPRYVSARTQLHLNVRVSAIAEGKSLDFQRIDVDDYSVIDGD